MERLGKKERKMEGREVKERKEEGKKGGPLWPGETAAATLDTYRVGTEGLWWGEYPPGSLQRDYYRSDRELRSNSLTFGKVRARGTRAVSPTIEQSHKVDPLLL